MTMVAIDRNTVRNMDYIQLLDLLVTCKTMWNIFMVHMSSSSIIFDFVLEVDWRADWYLQISTKTNPSFCVGVKPAKFP